MFVECTNISVLAAMADRRDGNSQNRDTYLAPVNVEVEVSTFEDIERLEGGCGRGGVDRVISVHHTEPFEVVPVRHLQPITMFKIA